MIQAINKKKINLNTLYYFCNVYTKGYKHKGRVMNKDTIELLDLIKLRNNQMQDILKNVKSNGENTTNRINLEFVINNLHTLNLFIDKDIEKKACK
jgi:hypothetical protein